MALAELQRVIQRCQGLSEANFKEEDFIQFQSAGQRCLEEGLVVEVLEIIEDERNKDIIRSMGWNFLSALVGCTLHCDKEDENRALYLRTLNQIIQRSNPKELVIGLLEQIEEATVDRISETILLLLDPLQKVLLQLGNKKAYSVGLCLSTVLTQLSQLPVPYCKEQWQEDKYGLCQCCSALVLFANPFVNEISQNAESVMGNDDNGQLRDELVKFCTKSLEYPLLGAQLEQIPEDPFENPLRQFAGKILGFLLSLGEPLLSLVIYPERSKRKEDLLHGDLKYTTNSLACLAYLLFVQYIGINYFPAVFSPSFVLQFNMEYISVLLKRTEESVLSKGLALYEHCLLMLEDNSLLHQYLEIRNFLSVPQELVKVMTLCPIKHLRKKSLEIFQLYIDKLETEGKYKLFRCLFKTSNHAGVEGYIIQNIKNQIDLALKPGHENVWFSGLRLIPLLHIALSLPEGAETDLLQNSDRIMASLNLLRYLLIRDNEYENLTGIWTELSKIDQNFLKPLHTGLNMSKAHYEAEIKSNRENKKRKDSPVCSITVGGEKLPNMTTEMQLQVLQSALFTFDLIESVLARIEELIEVKGKFISEEGSRSD
ncbi:glomulin, FKBP associated protein a isoform X1 [Latimeria chalumnae]|uniref:glomulin, FKBP associated protein a isoform X1 n=1 Tax=Latimeria chalumnae TaxID=7897 RepID=UPI0006D8FE5F|nr:PREDICTED: glomulin [Latimeria chalumnae]|eukprot:XP_014347284.1 PREDICTED: glomulin [Latimeria chalumnae]